LAGRVARARGAGGVGHVSLFASPLHRAGVCAGRKCACVYRPVPGPSPHPRHAKGAERLHPGRRRPCGDHHRLQHGRQKLLPAHVGGQFVLGLCRRAGGRGEVANALVPAVPSIRVTDSVTDGISYFYAEVRRLKALLDALQAPDPRPLFFLIDEIFRGTNNRERLLGSRAYIRQLSGKNGVGVIATHDLELVQLATELEQVNNYHFRDAVENGRMIFDYTLRPGPSPTTNALKIMAQEGLPVPPDLLT